MLNDLIKLFAEEPEKIEKAVLRGVKILLNILIAAWLYKLLIGPYDLFPLDSFSEWQSFLLSGRILVCLLFYFISEYGISRLFTLPGYLLSWLATRIKSKTKPDDIQTFLKMTGIIKYDDRKEVPLPGKHIDVLVDISRAFGDEKAKSEIEALRSTFISNVLDLYSTFVMVYFIVLSAGIRTVGLTVLVLGVLLFVLFFYAVINGMIEYLSKHYEEIIKSMSFIKINGLVYGVMASYGVYPDKPPKDEGIGKQRVFYRGGKEYVLCRPVTEKKMLVRGDEEIEQLLQKRRKNDRIFIIVIEHGIVTDSAGIRTKHSNDLILVEYKNEDDLRSQLNTMLSTLY